MAKNKAKLPHTREIRKYKKISGPDRKRLNELMKDFQGTVEWWALDKVWSKRYGYTLRVQLIYDFIEELIVPSGKGAGSKFILRPFQKDFISDVYGPVDKNNLRTVLRAIYSLGRKGGKTMLIACLVLVHLVGPESIMNGEIYSAANTRQQASKVFQYAAQIVRADPELLSYINVVDSTKTMVCYMNGSVYRAISADAGSNYGENPSLVLYDELAQSKNAALYNALDTSMEAREEPLFIVISTQSPDPQHILSMLIDDGLTGNDPTIVCHLYSVAEDADEELIFSDIKTWKEANPALGDFKSIKKMRAAADKARRMPTMEAAFRNLHLNQRVDAKSPLIPRAEWEGCKSDCCILPGEDIYLGLDLSGKVDLSALVAVSANHNDDRVKCWFWKPEETMREHEKRDRVPYMVWKDAGFLEVTPGRAIQHDWIAERIGKIKQEYNILGVAFDRWRIDDLLNAFERAGIEAYNDSKDDPLFGALRLVPWGQGFADMSPAVEALEISVLDRKLKHDGHPVLTWNISNSIAISDPSGNKKLDKSKSRFRIDGVVALAMAMGLKSRDMKKEDEPSIYEKCGVKVF